MTNNFKISQIFSDHYKILYFHNGVKFDHLIDF